MTDDDEGVLRLGATPGRRVIGTGSVAALGAMLVWGALTAATVPLSQAVMAVLGLMALWLARRMWRATDAHLVLTQDALVSSDGRILARMDDIVSVARGPFAFKPSNGVMITLRRRGPLAWEPGLWWRLGRRIGIGGVTAKTPARVMAEAIEARIAARGDG